MRVSRLMLVTQRDVPAEAEIVSHQLLVRGGYIRRVTSGIYAYMPLMWRVLRKIKAIVEEEMDNAGALQTLLPQLHPSELWERSGRWQSYTAGEGIMFHLMDRQKRSLGLGPTHEEVITKIADEQIHSYKQLPVNIYQIQTKFRDEIRPRFGLMRSREFIMKDSYSFHSNEKDLGKTYKSMEVTYKRIFARCGLETVAVDADSGAIGGSASQEFMVTADAGEDLILTSKDGLYAANQEKAVSIPKEAILHNPSESKTISTPNQNSILELCSTNNLEPSQIVKVIIMIAILEEQVEQPLLLSIRGDQEINEVKVINFVAETINKQVIKLDQVNDEEKNRLKLDHIPFGFLGPDLKDNVLENISGWQKQFLRVTDHSAASLDCFVCGANVKDKHRIGMSWEKLGELTNKADIRKAQKGESCVHDPTMKLEERHGIEIGHIFQLGRKYSKSLQATFTNEQGQEEAFWMGCYGLGITRLAQAAIEQHHDEHGICWPLPIAPFEAVIVVINMKEPIQEEISGNIYKAMLAKGIDVLLDDRSERAGVKFKDADLIGIPWRIVVGRDAANGKVEIVQRVSRETLLVDSEQAIQRILQEKLSK